MHTIAVPFVLVTSLFAQAKEADESMKKAFEEGRHYVRLETPVRTANPDKIEVAEVFWYGCGHCYAFEPALKKWRQRLPEDVVFVESPVIWGGDTEIHVHIFYTSKALGVLDKMHDVVFDAMHLKKLKLRSTDEIRDLYEQQGIAADKFDNAFESFGVDSLVTQAGARARSYGITGTPEIVVNGTYRISGKLAGSQTNMLAVAEYLVCKINAEKSAGNGDGQKQMSSFCASYAH